MTIYKQLEGWGFNMKALKGEGAFLSPPKVPRAFSTNQSKIDQPKDTLTEDEWCIYGGLPSPKAYM